jgi:hypothetical protein
MKKMLHEILEKEFAVCLWSGHTVKTAFTVCLGSGRMANFFLN